MQISEAAVNPGGKPSRIPAIAFIRAICAIGIIAFHVSCYTAPEAVKLLHTYANGNWGSIFVGIFFLISGGVLYLNYPSAANLKSFYYKRWKAIFPMFYVTWLYYYLNAVIAAGTPFYNGSPWTLLLTAVGLDGYLAYRIPGYYIVGEWFLGAIVLLYCLYPLYQKAVSRCIVVCQGGLRKYIPEGIWYGSFLRRCCDRQKDGILTISPSLLIQGGCGMF